MTEPTPKAAAFMKANDKNKVYAGYANETGEGGGGYTLTNEKTYKLSLEDCRSLPEGYPKWIHDHGTAL